MNRLNRLLSRVECDPPLLAAGEISDWPPGFPVESILRMAAPATTAPCPACDGEHTGRVVALDHSLQIVCRQCGPSPVSGDVLRRWEIVVPRLLAQLSAVLGIRGTVSELVPGHLWNWGTAAWAGKSRNVVFACRAHRAVPLIAEAMARRPASVVFVADEVGVCRWTGNGSRLIDLSVVLSELDERLQFDRDFIVALLGEDSPPKTPRRASHREARAAAIEKLTHELQRHLLAARDHAVATRRQTGSPGFLPRPTQVDLARRTKLSESAVSRALQDKSALMLRMLWDTADDLNLVMSWSGAIRPPAEVEPD